MSAVPLQLEVLGEDARTVPLPERGQLVVGSSAERATLVLTGQGVDAAHCAVTRDADGSWTLQDLGSPYGTRVNGDAVSTHVLAEGDTILIGSRRLRVTAAPRPARSATPPAERPGRAPRRFGGFRLERRLGRGSMGQVYLAIQESLNRPVALKVLAPELAADRDFVASFQAEARAAAALGHPNVVVVYDVGEAGGRHYLSMEFMAGGSLEQRLRSGPLPWREVLDVLHDTAAGLMYAETCGIVHRDIKPANLMLSGTGTIKIADLGLATSPGDQVDAGGGRKVRGTPHFIAPEQARGDAVDHRADLYALGATAYRLLSGETPFSGASTRDILRAHLHERPPSLKDVVPGLPDSLDRLVQRLMAKDPAERPANARALLEEVDRQRLAADRTAEATQTASRRSSSAPLLFAAVVFGIVAVLVSIVLMREGPVEEPAPEVAEGGTGTARGDESEGDGAFFDPKTSANPFDDVERDLRILDLEAQIAYGDIPRDAGTEARINALRDLVDGFDGTDTAARARDEIVELEARAREERLEAARLDQLVQETTSSLREFVDWPPPEGTLPRAGDALRKLQAFPPPPAALELESFEAERSRLAAEIVAASLAALAAENERVDGYLEQGDFASARAVVADLLPRLDLPAFEPGHEPEGFFELEEKVGELRLRATELDDAERAWTATTARDDRRALADALGASSGFLDELRDGRFAAVDTRLAALIEETRGPERRAFLEQLRVDVERASTAFRILIDTFDADPSDGGWRRRAFRDPRRSAGTERAVTVDAEGIRIEAGDDPWIPWSAFTQNASALHQLFTGRLTREYEAEESAAIVTLLRLGAIAEAAAAARDELANGAREAPDLTEPFQVVASWLETDPGAALAAQTERLIRERDAARILQDVLVAVRRESWSLAVDGIETLLEQHGDTLLVLMLSDGSDTEVAASDDD